MKKLTALLLFLAVTTGVMATGTQPAKTPEQRATKFSDRMVTDLGVNSTQQKQIYDLALVREQQLDQLKQQFAGQDRSAWATQRKQVRDDFQAGMKKILTADQYTKWDQMKQERKKKMRRCRCKCLQQDNNSGTTTGDNK